LISRPKKTVSPDGLLFYPDRSFSFSPLHTQATAPTISAMKQPLQIDATGMLCPLPLMHLKKAVSGCAPGEEVVITVTDEHAELDFATWCERFGHGLQRGQVRGEVMAFTIRVGSP
jgi:tRNA 2-thiouridine synthesizing protein A